MVTIETRWIGPTNTKGSRIIAQRCDWKRGDPRAIVSADHALSHEAAHDEAARKLCQDLGWTGEFVRGSRAGGYVYVWESEPRVTF